MAPLPIYLALKQQPRHNQAHWNSNPAPKNPTKAQPGLPLCICLSPLCACIYKNPPQKQNPSCLGICGALNDTIRMHIWSPTSLSYVQSWCWKTPPKQRAEKKRELRRRPLEQCSLIINAGGLVWWRVEREVQARGPRRRMICICCERGVDHVVCDRSLVKKWQVVCFYDVGRYCPDSVGMEL